MNAENLAIKIEKVGVSFGGIRALNEVSMDIHKAKINALIGPNGAGKTTLFNCVTGFYKTTDGEILFEDRSGSWQRAARLLGESFVLSDLVNPLGGADKLFYKLFGGSFLICRKGIARTFQNIRLFKKMTVIENLLVAQHPFIETNLLKGVFNTKGYQSSEEKAVTEAMKWLKFVGLEEDANRIASELPYGHQRKIEIARSLCCRPKVICLDEPAAGLNPAETKDLSDLIVKINAEHNVTVFLIEHDMDLVMSIADIIYVLNYGEIIASGTAEQIRKNDKVIEAYLGSQT